MYPIYSLTIEKVTEMIRDGNDNFDNFVAVTHEGMVSLQVSNQYDGYTMYRYYFDAFCAGNGYVGENAAKDTDYVTSVYKGIIYAWKTCKTGFYDMWRGDTKHLSVSEIDDMDWPK